MIDFIRKNFEMIGKFFITHFVMSMLGLMVGLAVLVIEGETTGFTTLSVIAGCFTVGFMLFLHYDESYFFAVKEGISCRANGEKPDYLRGLKISLIGSIPIFLAAIVTVLVILLTAEGQDTTPVPLLFFYLFQGSYVSFYALIEYIGIIGFVCITPLPAIIASTLAYYIGCQDKTLRGMLGFNVKPPYDGPIERKPKNK